MRKQSWMAVAVATMALMGTGCRGGPAGRSMIARGEPSLDLEGADGTVIAEAPPTTSPGSAVTFADRHPLLYKPREYYDSAGNNKLVKVTAGTVIGIPAGILGEIRQIVGGRSADRRSY